jgi:hypothetical protein
LNPAATLPPCGNVAVHAFVVSVHTVGVTFEPPGGAETIVTPKSPRRSAGPVTVKDCTGTFCTLMSVVESVGVNDGQAVA